MVGKRCDRDVIVEVDRERSRKRLGSIGLAFVDKRFGELAEISVEHSVESLAPGCRDALLVGLADNGLHISREHVGHLIVRVLVLPVVEAAVGFLGHYAVILPHVGHIERAAALGEVESAVHAHIFVGLVVVAMTHDEHFRKIHLFSGFAQNLILEERQSRKTPACARLILILDRCDRHYFHIRKLELLDAVGFLLAIVRADTERERKHSESGY